MVSEWAVTFLILGPHRHVEVLRGVRQWFEVAQSRQLAIVIPLQGAKGEPLVNLWSPISLCWCDFVKKGHCREGEPLDRRKKEKDIKKKHYLEGIWEPPSVCPSYWVVWDTQNMMTMMTTVAMITCRVPILWKYLSGMPRTSLLYRASSFNHHYGLLHKTVTICNNCHTCVSASISAGDGNFASPTRVFMKYRTWFNWVSFQLIEFLIWSAFLTWRSNWGKGQIWKKTNLVFNMSHFQSTWTGRPTKAREGLAMLMRCL